MEAVKPNTTKQMMAILGLQVWQSYYSPNKNCDRSYPQWPYI